MAGEITTGASRPELQHEHGFDQAFDYFWQQLSAEMLPAWTDDEAAAAKADAYEKEIDFYNRVFDAVDLAALASDNEIVCLYDVDSTMGEVREDYQSERDFLLRPAMQPLLANITIRYPGRIGNGILSIRPQQSLDAEMEHPSFLTPIRPFLTPELVCSSGPVSRRDPFMSVTEEYRGNEADLAEFLESLQGVVRSDVLDAVGSGQLHNFDWYDSKLKMISEFLRLNIASTLVVVDDLPYAAYLDTNLGDGRLVGVCVTGERQMLLPYTQLSSAN